MIEPSGKLLLNHAVVYGLKHPVDAYSEGLTINNSFFVGSSSILFKGAETYNIPDDGFVEYFSLSEHLSLSEKPVEKEGQSGKPQSSIFQAVRLALSPSLSWAEEVTTISNATIRSLKAKMKSRFSQMKSYYQKGMLKEGNDGYVSIASTQGLGLKEKRNLNSLVSAENGDRRTLYAEVAKALKIDTNQINRIANIFAKEWQKSVK